MQNTFNSFHLLFVSFHKTLKYSLCLNFLFTPFALLTSLSLSAINDYILDFKPTNSIILDQFNSSFILPNTFLFKLS